MSHPIDSPAPAGVLARAYASFLSKKAAGTLPVFRKKSELPPGATLADLVGVQTSPANLCAKLKTAPLAVKKQVAALLGGKSPAAGGVQASRPRTSLPPQNAPEVPTTLTMQSDGSSGAPGAADVDSGFTDAHAAEIAARMNSLNVDQLQFALDMVPQSYQKLRWDLAARITSGSAPTSNVDLSSMTHDELLAALAATPASDNARRYEIAARINAGAPVISLKVGKLSAAAIHARLQSASGNQERWELAAALSKVDSLEGMTAPQLEAGLAAAKTPKERGRYAFALAAVGNS